MPAFSLLLWATDTPKARMWITSPVWTQSQRNECVKLALGIAKKIVKLNSQSRVQNGETQRTSCSKKRLIAIWACPTRPGGLSTRTVKGEATTDMKPRNGIGYRRSTGWGTKSSHSESKTDKTKKGQSQTQPWKPEEKQGSVNSPRLHAPRETVKQLWFLFSIYLSEPKLICNYISIS